MAVINLKTNQHFIKSGEKVKEVYIILKGSVRQVTPNYELLLENGCIIGMMEGNAGTFLCDYVAKEDSMLVSYPYRKPEDYKTIFHSQPEFAYAFTHAAIIQCKNVLNRYTKLGQTVRNYYMFCMERYEDYKTLCANMGIEMKSYSKIELVNPLTLNNKIEQWEIDYNLSIAQRQPEELKSFYESSQELCIGEIMHASKLIYAVVSNIEQMSEYIQNHKNIIVNDNKADLVELYFDLAKQAATKGKDLAPIHQKVQEIHEFLEKTGLFEADKLNARFQEYKGYDFDRNEAAGSEDSNSESIDSGINILEQDCMQFILDYAGYENEEAQHMKAVFEEFSSLRDIYSTDDRVRTLRKQITTAFYDIYAKAFFKSMEVEQVPAIMQMFFNFGFMDVSFVGEESATALYNQIERMNQFNSANVYTIYEWLKAIYNGEKEPSKNEFDMDYAESLTDMRKGNKITEVQQKELMTDTHNKVRFEISNMFTSTNRLTSGRILSFCPILSEHDVISSVERMLVTAKKVNDALNAIQEVDFSIFYREVIFSDPKHDIMREAIMKEVIPDIILMPNAGSKSMMWQETAGVKRDTPARFIFPILTVSDMSDMMIEVAGRYRWEICRKIQGMRWNDIREKSLTSEYCDYLQFYRKNSDLSPDAKEKVKNALARAKNSYREVFVKDYQSWVKYESAGSFRLNKIVREMVFRYCPFSKSIREELMGNPTYHDMFSRYEILNEKKLHRVEAFNEKYRKVGGEITSDLEDNLEFYKL